MVGSTIFLFLDSDDLKLSYGRLVAVDWFGFKHREFRNSRVSEAKTPLFLKYIKIYFRNRNYFAIYPRAGLAQTILKWPLWLMLSSKSYTWVRKRNTLAEILVSVTEILIFFFRGTVLISIFLPWSWRFIQGSFALFSFCKKLIQTERILFLFFKLHRTVSTLSTICSCKLPVWLKPNNRGQKEYTYTAAVLNETRGGNVL